MLSWGGKCMLARGLQIKMYDDLHEEQQAATVLKTFGESLMAAA